MRKFLEMFKYEMKNILRDKMTMTMLIFPFIFLLMSTLLIPNILKMVEGNPAAAMYGSIITFVMLISMGTFMIAALLAFMLLDRKDDKTLHTIAATPLSISGYIIFQSVYNYILTVIMNIIVLAGTKLFASDAYTFEMNNIVINIFDNLSYLEIVVCSLISGVYMPALGLFLSGIANNKIEGFAYVKSSGIILIIPILALLDTFSGSMQYILGIAPNFWAIKGIFTAVLPGNDADMSFTLYMLIGAVYGLAINIPAYKFFIKRAMRA